MVHSLTRFILMTDLGRGDAGPICPLSHFCFIYPFSIRGETGPTETHLTRLFAIISRCFIFEVFQPMKQITHAP